MVNYLKLDFFSFLWSKFIFVDTESCYSIQLLHKAGIRASHIRVMRKINSPYRLIVCKIRRTKESRFAEVMNELRNQILLMGYTKYDEVCELLEKCGIITDSHLHQASPDGNNV